MSNSDWIDGRIDQGDADAVTDVPKDLIFLSTPKMQAKPRPQLEKTTPFGLAGSPFLTRKTLAIGASLAIVLVFGLGVLTSALFDSAASEMAEITATEVEELAAVETDQSDPVVTRAARESLLDVGLAPHADPAQSVLAQELAEAVLAGLKSANAAPLINSPQSKKPAEKVAISVEEKLQVLRNGVLSGAYTVKVIKRNGTSRLCLRVKNATVSQDEAVQILEAAADKGDIKLPEELSTADGKLDADTLLFNLVQTSLANDGTPQGAEAAREMSRIAFAASDAKTQIIAGARVYTVERGDSLAYISLQFYGRPNDYPRIFEANRDRLSSPNKILIGQQLKIPS